MLPNPPRPYGQLYQVLPFTTVVLNLDLTGRQLRAVFEAASGSAGRLHVGGATFTYHVENPAGQRLLSATVGGRALADGRLYHVVTIDYLDGGGDGHTEFKDATNVIYGDIEVDAVAAFMTAHSPLDPTADGPILQTVVPGGTLALQFTLPTRTAVFEAIAPANYAR